MDISGRDSNFESSNNEPKNTRRDARAHVLAATPALDDLLRALEQAGETAAPAMALAAAGYILAQGRVGSAAMCAAVGALIGEELTKGKDRDAGMVGGAIVGGLIGFTAVGRTLVLLGAMGAAALGVSSVLGHTLDVPARRMVARG